MKKILTLLFAALLLTACHQQQSSATDDLTESQQIQTGDLLLIALPMDYDFDAAHPVTDISEDTGEVIFIHVAIADVVGDSLYVIDATVAHGVDRHPIDTLLSTFTLKDGSHPRIDLYRLNDNSQAEQFVAKAKEFCGRGYNMSFDLKEYNQYCSELVRNSYVGSDTLFDAVPLNFNSLDGTLPTYWGGLFQLINSPMPQGAPGILPRDLAESPLVHLVRRNIAL